MPVPTSGWIAANGATTNADRTERSLPPPRRVATAAKTEIGSAQVRTTSPNDLSDGSVPSTILPSNAWPQYGCSAPKNASPGFWVVVQEAANSARMARHVRIGRW